MNLCTNPQKTPLPSPSVGLEVQGLRKPNAKPLSATDFSEADRERFWAKVRVLGPDECWEWTASTSGGYGQLFKHGSMVRSNRLAFVLKRSDLAAKDHVLHHCDNRLCCNPSHLFLGSSKENMRDCMSKGRHAHGERAPTAKLTDATAALVRAKRAEGLTHQVIADMVGVSVGAIAHVCKRRSWAHIP